MIATTSSDTKNQPLDVDATLTVADAVWVGAALLHRQRPAQSQFSAEEIVGSVEANNLTRGSSKSIWQHVNQHCVANRKPQPNRARILYATSGGHRRLFRLGDRYDPAREGAPMHPDWNKLPAKFADLRYWYETVWNQATEAPIHDPLLDLAGTGRDMWNGQTADAYVATLREGWDRSA